MLKIQPIDRPVVGALSVLGVGTLALSLAVALHDPSSNQSERGSAKLSDSTRTRSEAAGDTKSRKNPLFTVEVVTPNLSPSSIEQASKEREQKSSNDWWLVEWTGVIALFTVVLSLVAGVQAAFFWRQLGIMSQGLTDTKAAADAAAEAAKAATKQAKISEDTFVRTERPYIFIDGVRFITRDEDGDWFVSYTVANFGKVPAIVDAVWLGFVSSDRGEPEIPPLMGDDHTLFTSRIFASNERRDNLREYIGWGIGTEPAGIILGADKEPMRDVPDILLSRQEQLFFRAVIKYHGPFTSDHETGALWLHLAEGVMVGRGDEHYNHIR
jgi:hypothetical protein